MAYDEGLAERIREFFRSQRNVIEKEMFGGITFMLNGNMCVGVHKDHLMVRVGKDNYDKVVKLPHVKPMDFTKNPMIGFIFVEPEGVKKDNDLERFIKLGLEYVKTFPKK